jgi:hypothetical protein
MQPLTDKQKKAAWIIAGILVLIHFLPGMVHSIKQTVAMRQHAAAVTTSPYVAAPMPVRPAVPDPAMTAALSPEIQAKFTGVFEGGLFLPNNDQCRVHLEIRPSPDKPGFISGYETRSCFNVSQFVAGTPQTRNIAEAMKDASPVSTVMTGSPDEGDISFQVDKTIGSSPFVCPMVNYRTSVFGAKSIVAQWRAVDCPAGSVVLTRVGG